MPCRTWKLSAENILTAAGGCQEVVTVSYQRCELSSIYFISFKDFA